MKGISYFSIHLSILGKPEVNCQFEAKTQDNKIITFHAQSIQFPTTRKPNYSVEIGKLKMTFLISSIFSQLITTPNRLARRSR